MTKFFNPEMWSVSVGKYNSMCMPYLAARFGYELAVDLCSNLRVNTCFITTYY